MKIHYEEEYSLEEETNLPSELFNRCIWLDIETRKIPAEQPWHQKTRWETFMVGVAGFCDPGILFLTVVSGTEEEIVTWLSTNFEGYEVRYTATREFDEMVLRGRFTNARHAHSLYPGNWYNLDAVNFRWRNIRKIVSSNSIQRSPDVSSKEVPAYWKKGLEAIVALHNKRDVLEMLLLDPEISMDPILRAELALALL